ncbi:MAG: glycosyltransferase family 9 protein [Candidatus Latescibacteria bacterium]|nr:glycosyltransferase family 9 protein [Candidatus Latescibacterota bacterium]
MKATWLKGSLWERAAGWWQQEEPQPGEAFDVFKELEGAAKILVVPNDRVGGLVIGAPVCRAVRQRYPRARISLLVDEGKGGIARQLPFADEVVTCSLGRSVGSPETLKVRQQLRDEGFDLAICLGADCSFRLAWLCGCCGARIRLGFSRPGLKPFNIEVVSKATEIYEGDQYLGLLRLIGLEELAETRWAVEAERVAQARSRYLDEENSRYAIGVDLSGGEGQGLSQRQLDELVGRVIERGVRPVLFFSAAEQRQLNFLHKSHGNRILPFGQDDLAGSLALLANCRALIACNTELLHLARGMQVPVVGIFAEDPRRWIHPDSRWVKVLQAGDLRSVGIPQIARLLEEALAEGAR